MTVAMAAGDKWHVQCTTSLTSDTNPGLLVVFADERYMFQCPENTTRAYQQDRISRKKLGRVFLSSSVEIQSTSGLGGLLLGMGEKDGSKLDIHGPEGIDHVLASLRYHTRRDKMTIQLHLIPSPDPLPADTTSDELEIHSELPQPVFSDKNIRVFALSALAQESNKSTNGSPIARARSKRSRSPTPPNLQQNGQKRLQNGHADEDTLEHQIQNDLRDEGLPLDWWGRGFHPRHLTGPRASEWRALVLRDMFRGGQHSPPAANNSDSVSKDKSYIDTPGRRLASPAYNNARLPSPNHAKKVALSYLVIGPPRRGKFLPNKAKEQGVKPGPDFSKLVAGIPVELPDGTVVEPASCAGPGGSPPMAFLVIYCPSLEYVESTVALKTQEPLQSEHASLRCVFHFLGQGVVEDARYAQWMNAFPSDIQHFVSSPGFSVNSISFVSTAILQMRLSRLDNNMFKVPQYQLAGTQQLKDITNLPANSDLLRMGDSYSMAPGTSVLDHNYRPRSFECEVDSSHARELESRLTTGGEQDIEHSKAAWSEYLQLVEKAKIELMAETTRRAALPQVPLPGADIEVTALGTGSAVPSNYRNVSSTLLHLPSGGYILLDAGEGTYGQLARRFGKRCDEVLRNLSLVFISHMHADHHGGLANLLKERSKLNVDNTLYILGSFRVNNYIQDLDVLQDLGLGKRTNNGNESIVFLDSGLLEKRERMTHLDACLRSISATSILVVPVLHRAVCHGLIVHFEDGCKIVYSGDTKPCPALAAAGKGATLLIHESTLEDDMPEVAEYKGHSTFSQALEVAKQMQAKTCLLTHFSQRYPKFPPLADSSNGEEQTSDVAVAFDLMTICIGDFWKVSYYVKALQMLFSEFEGDAAADGETEAISDGTAAMVVDAKAASQLLKKQTRRAKKDAAKAA